MIEVWCRDNYLLIQGDKTLELIFTKRYKIISLEKMIAFQEYTKFFLSRLLLWRKHLGGEM